MKRPENFDLYFAALLAESRDKLSVRDTFREYGLTDNDLRECVMWFDKLLDIEEI